jgi:hypothetical protein
MPSTFPPKTTSKQRYAALTKILEIELAFVELLPEEEIMLTGNDGSDGTGPIKDVCFSLWDRLGGLQSESKELAMRGDGLSIQFAKELWLDEIATYCGIISRRFAAGELLLDSEPVTARLREQLAGLHDQLAVIYGPKLAALEARMTVDPDEETGLL